MRTIRVTGKGNLALRPDLTRVTLNLTKVCKEYAAALADSAAETEKLKNILTGSGFAREDLKTLQFSVDAEYEGYQQEGEYKQRLVGYRYRHAMKIEFPLDNRRLGEVLYALAHSELQPEMGVAYTVKDRETAKGELLAKAVADAIIKAYTLTKAAGVTLKDIQNIDYSFGEMAMEVRPMNRMLAADCKAGGFETDIVPEDIALSDTVTVVWEIG